MWNLQHPDGGGGADGDTAKGAAPPKCSTAAGAAEDTEGNGGEEPIIKRTAKWPRMKDVKARQQAEEDSP